MFDIVFVFILSLFSLFSFLKGFVRSAFSVINWILSLIISYFATPLIVPLFEGKYPEIVLYPVIGTIIFIVSIIIFGLFTAAISRSFLKVIPEVVDKSFGFAFGFAKGYFIMALFFAILTTVYASDLVSDSKKSEAKDGRVGPDWLVEAKSYSVLQLGADMLQPIIDKVMEELNDTKNDVKSDEEKKAKKTEPKPQITKPKTTTTQPKTTKIEPKPQITKPKSTTTQPKTTKTEPKSSVTKPSKTKENTDQNALDKKIDEINKSSSETQQKGYNEKEIAKKNQLIEAIQ